MAALLIGGIIALCVIFVGKKMRERERERERERTGGVGGEGEVVCFIDT